MIKDIRIIPDEVLKKTSLEVHDVDESIRNLIDSMFTTMYNAQGIGLAAVQIGILKRILVMDVGTDIDTDISVNKKKHAPISMINPVIRNVSDDLAEEQEGCLSLPGITETIKRPAACSVSYIDYNGNEQLLQCEGLLARCLQHEIDHLNGTLIIDYLSRLKRSRIIKKFKRLKDRNNSEDIS